MLEDYIRRLEEKGAFNRLKKIKEKIFKFNSVRTQWNRPEDHLDKAELFVLEFLEGRSYPNNGDTKIYNNQISEILQIAKLKSSKASVERILKKLEDFGYIVRFTIKNFVRSRGHPLSHRIIRCRRILLRERFNVKSKKELNFF